MDEIFEKLIYNSEEEKQEGHKMCLNKVLKSYEYGSQRKKIAPNEIEKCLKIWDGECPPWEAYEYVLEKNKTEGQMLFNYVRKKGADKLWAGKAWQNKTCKRICPYGEFCKKSVVSINENKMCYGQLLYND